MDKAALMVRAAGECEQPEDEDGYDSGTASTKASSDPQPETEADGQRAGKLRQARFKH